MFTLPLASAALALSTPQIPDLPRELLSSPRSKVSARVLDLDQDGLKDVVYIGLDYDEIPARLVVHWGMGGGQLGTRDEIDTGLSIKSLILTDDLDGDLDDDIVFQEEDTGDLYVLVNDGRREDLTVLFVAQLDADDSSIELLDIDGDGDRDLLTRRFVSGFSLIQPWCYERTGAMSFAPAVSVVAPGVTVADLLYADFDGDGDLDATVGFRQNDKDRVIQYSNGGSLPLNFAGQIEVSERFEFYGDMIARDIDGDSDLDIVMMSYLTGTDSVAVMRNQGGTLTPRTSQVDVPEGGRLDIRDATGTGANDIVIGGFDGRVLVVPDQGGGTYASWYSLAPGFESMSSFVIEDLDADGRDDLVRLVTETIDFAFVTRLLVNGSTQVAGGPMSFGPAMAFEAPFGRPEGITTADFTGDGMPDIVVSSHAGTHVGIHENDGRGGFLPLRAILTTDPDAEALACGDLDADGDIDLVVVALERLLWLENPGNGSAWSGHLIHNTPNRFGVSVLVVDLDGDGDLDVVHASERFGGSQNRVNFWENSGSGGFAGPTLLFAPTAPQRVRALTAADLNGDGRLDLVFGASERATTARLAWAPRLASGAYDVPRDVDTYPIVSDDGPGYWDVVAEDLDGDGDVDLVAASATRPSRLARFMNDGSGTFVASDLDSWTSWTGMMEVELVDLDLDGTRDLVVSARPASNFGSELGVYPGLGGGQFGPFQPTGSGLGFTPHLVSSDFDQDGDTDFASVYFQDNRVSVYRNSLTGIVGESYCGPAVANSTGLGGRIAVTGSPLLVDNRARLRAFQLPQNTVGLFLTSRTEAFSPTVPNSVGALCLGGTIGRYAQPNQIQSSGAAGVFDLEIDLTSLPQATGTAVAMVGETWSFQAWYRDSVGGGATSNFTDGARASWE